MSGSRSKQKGAKGERDLVRELEMLGIPAHRLPQVETAPDILADISAPLVIECKRHKKANVRGALKQVVDAMAGVPPGAMRAVYIRDDRAPPFWVVPHESFIQLAKGFNVQISNNTNKQCIALVPQLSSESEKTRCDI